RRPPRGEEGKLVHQAAVPRALLGGVVVILIAGVGLGAIDPERSRGVRISLDQARREPVDRRRTWPRVKRWLPGRVDGHRIGREVLIERVVLLEDDDEVPDRRGRRGRRGGRRRAVSREEESRAERDRECGMPDDAV